MGFIVTSPVRLRTPWRPGQGLQVEVGFNIKLQSEPVAGLTGPYRAFFKNIIDELQDSQNDFPQIPKLLIPTPNHSGQIGIHR